MRFLLFGMNIFQCIFEENFFPMIFSIYFLFIIYLQTLVLTEFMITRRRNPNELMRRKKSERKRRKKEEKKRRKRKKKVGEIVYQIN